MIFVYPLGSVERTYGGDPIFGTSVQIPAGILQPGITYEWRVYSIDIAGGREPSGYWNFTVSTLAAPLQLSPSNGGTVPTTEPTLQWSPALGAVAYTVFVYPLDDAGVGDRVYGGDDLIFATSVQVPAGALQHGTTYTWRVYSFNASATSGPSATWTFTVDDLHEFVGPSARRGPPDAVPSLFVRGRVQQSAVAAMNS